MNFITAIQDLIFIVWLSGAELTRLRARRSELQKCVALFGSQIEVAAVNGRLLLVNEFASLPKSRFGVPLTTSWGFHLTRCFGKLKDTLLSLISFHGYWVLLFTNKEMWVSGEGGLKSSVTGCTDGHIAQDHAENSFRFSSILHISREIIFIAILSLYENGEINRVREKDGVFAGN